MSSSRTNFTTLPFELQMQIFHDYFKVDGGYAFNGDSEKLTTANGKPIDLALMYTCRSIATQTKGMPLSLNTVHFSTVYHRDWTPLAGCLNFVTVLYPLLVADMVIRLEPFITPDMYSELTTKFPDFVPELRRRSETHQELLGEVEPREPDNILASPRLGDALSWIRDFQHGTPRPDANYPFTRSSLSPVFFGVRANQGTPFYALRLLAEKRPDEFAQLVFGTFPHWVDTHPAHEFLELGFNLWDIPSRSELSLVTSRLDVDFIWQMVDQWHYKPPRSYDSSSPYDPLHRGTRCREKVRFSAAAVSIRFLGGLTVDQRLQIRNVTLHEDFAAAGEPPFHAQGLAPFFRENSRLRVERRVSAMRCISEPGRLGYDTPGEVAWWLQEPRHPKHANYLTFRNSMPSSHFPICLAQWLLSALAVPEAGIPAESFTFVLEGGPYLDFCTDLFQQTVHRDVAWQKAYQASLQRGLLARWPRAAELVVEGFVEAIEHLINSTSFLRSDFNTGHPWDWENLVEEKTGFSQFTWVRSFYMHIFLPIDFPPAMDYTSILADNYEIQTESEYSQPHCSREGSEEAG
ncbi:hypothetical protein BKA56DRAFT_597639 [Ilyonectria sp. MPI-CAGE-AT-0026]|nr:hypothetical protein BKA56DRAFT_597639 [Ilyonectria sp. MPI-CAGE-AT-0026]